jgi:hypothetical protein
MPVGTSRRLRPYYWWDANQTVCAYRMNASVGRQVCILMNDAFTQSRIDRYSVFAAGEGIRTALDH